VTTVHQPRGEQRRRFFELLGAWAIAVAQPVLSALGDAPDHLLFRRASRWEIVVLAVFVVAGAPAAAWLIQLGASRVSTRLGDVTHRALLALFVAVFTARLARLVVSDTVGIAAIGAGVGGILAYAAVDRWPRIREWPRLLAWTAPLFLALFLVTSDASSLLFDDVAMPTAAVESNGRSVVLVTFDELPLETILLSSDRGIDADLFPSFARLAASSTWYQNATTVHDHTDFAVPAIVTGRRPDADAAPTAQDHPENLFTLLRGTHRMNVWEHFAMCPSETCDERHQRTDDSGLGRLIRDALTLSAAPFDNDPDSALGLRVVWTTAFPRGESNRFSEFADSVDSLAGPAVHYIHALLPHNRWALLPSGQTYDNPSPRDLSAERDGVAGTTWADDAVATRERTRHTLQAMHADLLLGELLDALDDGDHDDTVLVVTADHGIAFDPTEPFREATPGNVGSIAWVPLFVSASTGAEGRVVDRPVETIDILPTIADALGVEIPWHVDGTSLLGPAHKREPREIRSSLDSVGALRIGNEMRAVAARSRAVPAEVRPFATGLHDDLLGSAVSDSPVAASTGVRLLGASVPDFARVDVDSDELPVYVTAQVEPTDRRIAVALNGRIVGVGALAREGPETDTVSFVLPPWLVRSDANDVRFYVVADDGLAPL
jgi:hypothetical protein